MTRISLADFLRNNSTAILDDWERRVRARLNLTSTQPVLRDSVPEILHELADIIDSPEHHDNASRAHGLARYAEGYDLILVLAEYRELRQVILKYSRHWEGQAGMDLEPLSRMHEVFDQGIIAAVRAFSQRREEELETFVAILGHDLRNPLNQLATGAQVLQAKVMNDPVFASQQQQMSHAAANMRALIDDLLDFARVRRQGRMPVSLQSVQLDGICQRVVEETRALNPQREITLQMNCEVAGRWDEKRVEQALTNLLRNAVDHAEGPVNVSLRSTDESVHIDVTNHGHIAPDVLRDIFDPYRSHGPGSGIGLGLYIVRMIADAHGGEARAHCENDEVRVSMVLPREPETVRQPVEA